MPLNLPTPPGFQGLRDCVAITSYTRHLPHWRQDGATYFVTHRLADSLPQSKLRELAELQRQWEAELRSTQPSSHVALDEPGNRELTRRVIERIERWLDHGMGACLLRQPDVSQIVANAYDFFDGERYTLGAYVIMPNHVHLLLRPLNPQTMPLESILKSRKGYTAQRINHLLGRSGRVWQEESFDRIVRDDEHLWKCLQYIGRIPRLAGLPDHECPRWIRPEWRELGWEFEESD